MILYPINRRGIFGFIDKNGQQKIEFKYKSAKHLREGLAAVKLIDNWGYIDKDDNTIIDFKYFSASEFENGQANVASNSSNYYWIDKKEHKIQPDFGQVKLSSFTNVSIGKSGFLDKEGNVLGLIYESTRNSSEGFAAAKKNGKWGFVNKDTVPISAFEYNKVRLFKEGLVGVLKDDKWGFMNTKGKITLKPQFKDIRNFVGNLCFVKFEDGKWGYISKEGDVVWQDDY